MGGFDRPILHGLCTYGISGKQIVQNFLNGDHTKLKSIRCRFTSHVFPGETLQFNFWVNGTTITYAARTKERGKVVIIGDAVIEAAAKL